MLLDEWWFVCVYHLFVRNIVGTIEYRSINKNKNKLSDGLTGAECVNHNIVSTSLLVNPGKSLSLLDNNSNMHRAVPDSSG